MIAVAVALLCCMTALGANVFAAFAEQRIELKANGGEAQLVMDFPQAAAEEIASMQISLVISSGADVEFIPDGGLNAKIVESRYHSDTGVLTVYLAGTKALFSDAPLTVGRVKLGGSDASAAVKVEEGSIRFVRGSELVTPDGDISYPAPVTISTGSGSYVPPPFIVPPSGSSSQTDPASPSSSDTSAPPGSPSSASSSDATDAPLPEPVEPADVSSLADAIDRAGGYKRADYTEDSYGTLIKALNKAKAVLSNIGSTQDEIDEALLVLENAIGMLAPANTAPSGTDGYGSGDTSSAPNAPNAPNSSDSSVGGSAESTGGSQSADPEAPDKGGSSADNNGQSVVGEQSPSDNSQAPDASGSDSSEADKPNTAVMWVIIVTAALAVTAAALFAALKLKKK